MICTKVADSLDKIMRQNKEKETMREEAIRSNRGGAAEKPYFTFAAVWPNRILRDSSPPMIGA